METEIISFYDGEDVGSYPTYEEWKRKKCTHTSFFNITTSSYPTYEEWKRESRQR